MNTSITALFFCIDDFAKVFEDCERKQLISTGRRRMRSGKLSLSEMLFIMVLFHVSPFKNFKTFWHFGINQKRLMHFVQMVLNFDKMSRQINHDLQDADGV